MRCLCSQPRRLLEHSGGAQGSPRLTSGQEICSDEPDGLALPARGSAVAGTVGLPSQVCGVPSRAGDSGSHRVFLLLGGVVLAGLSWEPRVQTRVRASGPWRVCVSDKQSRGRVRSRGQRCCVLSPSVTHACAVPSCQNDVSAAFCVPVKAHINTDGRHGNASWFPWTSDAAAAARPDVRSDVPSTAGPTTVAISGGQTGLRAHVTLGPGPRVFCAPS